MPVLYILGGANGCGKTTWYYDQLSQGAIDRSLPFINIDNIVLNELGNYTPENIALGEQIAKERMSNLIDRKENFMIESNLSKSADYDWIEKMQSAGYETVLYFLATDNVLINKARVRERVKEGGHDVAEAIIEQRYRMGLSYLKSKIINFTEAYLVDSSKSISEKVALVRKGKVIDKVNAPASWVTETLFIAERLQQKKQQLGQSKEQKPEDAGLLKKLRNSQRRGRGPRL
jgi:predicted ABC-type ATPase